MKRSSSMLIQTWHLLPCFLYIFATPPHQVSGYSSGAAVDVCDTMIPGHGADPQITANPYKLSISSSQVNAFEPVNITLSSINGQDRFKGFMIQVRKPGGDKTIGEFRPIPGEDRARTLRCFGIANSAMTHTSGELKDRVTVQWIAPNVDDTEYQVYYSVVGEEDGGTYWTQIRHDEKILVQHSIRGTQPPPSLLRQLNEEKLAEIYNGCGQTKGCFGIPQGCVNRNETEESESSEDGVPKACELMVTWQKAGAGNTFELLGKLVEKPTSYVALGLSTDAEMGRDSVVGCAITDSQAVPTVQRYFNPIKRNQKHSEPLLGLKALEALNVEGYIFCKFQQDNHQISDLSINFDQSYHLLLSKGPVKDTGALGYHYEAGDKTLTLQPVRITDTIIV